jgi:hypothetical protein
MVSDNSKQNRKGDVTVEMRLLILWVILEMFKLET